MASKQGSDATWGDFKSIHAQWLLNDSISQGPVLTTVFKLYSDIPAIGFEQIFTRTLTGASSGDAQVVTSSFPSFQIPSACDRGFLIWRGSMINEGVVNQFCQKLQGEIPSGLDAGPFVLFNQDASSEASIFAPTNNFMSFSVAVDTANSQMHYGLMGNITTIPAGYSSESLIFFGKNGINNVVSSWGKLLLAKYENTRPMREADPTLSYLGYSTDNGAYYYYHTETGLNYEDTLLAVKKYSDSLNLPFRYVLLDSWWYFKGSSNGVKNWTAMPSVFPHGLQSFHENTGMMFQGHNRYWAPETDYAKQNGGQYDFIVEQNFAMPIARDFWNDLFTNSSKWGLRVYEQDWLYNEFAWIHHSLESATLARQWLLQMGLAAQATGLAIQYCMAWPRHVLQSLEIPAVSQARASDDYMAIPLNWRIGGSSILLDALNIAPSKDSSWSISTQPGAPKGHMEPHPALQTAVMVLSKGPVAFSDKIGYVDHDLIMSTCAADGKLLHPSFPAKSIDGTFAYRAFGNSQLGPNGQVTSTVSLISNAVFHHLLVADLLEDYTISRGDLHPAISESMDYVVYHKSTSGFEASMLGKNLNLTKCGTLDFQLWHFAPVFPTSRLVLLGEIEKVVPVSPNRFSNLVTYADDSSAFLQVNARGDAGERISVAFAQVGASGDVKIDILSCAIPDAGVATLEYPSMQCL
eukprot:TRINITY_DN4571_c0_g1_i1.p1 TRINITY_DN4571_c0_g1~~TRINITY_DN4571_c0_g1_i1.p1  ORF type:complete len:776 (+),score=200.17 TRINITY_DN4571_c0_g1_i1:255-2330(+)